MVEQSFALFSVFQNTMAYENTHKKKISISHQFGIYTTFAIHMTKFESKKYGGMVIKKQTTQWWNFNSGTPKAVIKNDLTDSRG